MNPNILALFCHDSYLLENLQGTLFFPPVTQVRINLLIGPLQLSWQQFLTALVLRGDALRGREKERRVEVIGKAARWL